jgi:hypothetical protein
VGIGARWLNRGRAGYGPGMLALIALVCFLLVLFHVSIESVDLMVLGFVFIAAHLAFGGGFYPAIPSTRR